MRPYWQVRDVVERLYPKGTERWKERQITTRRKRMRNINKAIRDAWVRLGYGKLRTGTAPMSVQGFPSVQSFQSFPSVQRVQRVQGVQGVQGFPR